MQYLTTNLVRAFLASVGLLLLTFLLTACGSSPRSTEIVDAAPPNPIDVSTIPDAVPKPEPITIAGNKSPYTVFNKTYTVMPDSLGYQTRGTASWYGTKFHGRKTSNGETYSIYRMTAAHKTLPIPSYVRVTNLENNRQVIVRVNDRGPFHGDRVIDLSYAAAVKLGYADKGTARVEIEAIDTRGQLVASKSEPIPTSTETKTETKTEVKNENDSLPPKHRSHYLQAGAFQTEQAALSLQQRLQGFTKERVFVERPDTEQSYYRVRIGPLASLIVAQQLRESLQSANLAVPNLLYQ